jgi:hypothetical protein
MREEGSIARVARPEGARQQVGRDGSGTYGPKVKHILLADKALLVGDEAADLLLSYAGLIAEVGRGDTITLHAIDQSGDEVVAGLLLNGGTALVTQTTSSTLPEPDNVEVIRYMRDRIASYRTTDMTDSPFGTSPEGS